MFNTFIKQIGLLVLHTLITFFICMFICSLFKLPGGEYGMSPLLLLIGSLILLGVYLIWTIGYFFFKGKILTTNRVIIYFTFVFFGLIIFTAIGDFFDIINLVFILSVTISSAIIYFLNKVGNVLKNS